jgi:hypothetical protein
METQTKIKTINNKQKMEKGVWGWKKEEKRRTKTNRKTIHASNSRR